MYSGWYGCKLWQQFEAPGSIEGPELALACAVSGAGWSVAGRESVDESRLARLGSELFGDDKKYWS